MPVLFSYLGQTQRRTPNPWRDSQELDVKSVWDVFLIYGFMEILAVPHCQEWRTDNMSLRVSGTVERPRMNICAASCQPACRRQRMLTVPLEMNMIMKHWFKKKRADMMFPLLQMNSKRSMSACPTTISWTCRPSSTFGPWTPRSSGVTSSWRTACGSSPSERRESSSSSSAWARDVTGSRRCACRLRGEPKPGRQFDGKHGEGCAPRWSPWFPWRQPLAAQIVFFSSKLSHVDRNPYFMAILNISFLNSLCWKYIPPSPHWLTSVISLPTLMAGPIR